MRPQTVTNDNFVIFICNMQISQVDLYRKFYPKVSINIRNTVVQIR